MRQIARRLKDGRLELVEVQEPAPPPESFFVSTLTTLIAARSMETGTAEPPGSSQAEMAG